MSGTPSGAPPAAIMLSPEERIEALLQQIVADRAQDAARMDAMQATIDSSIDLAALHRAAAAGGPPTLALQGQAAGPSWLRRIVDTVNVRGRLVKAQSLVAVSVERARG